MDAYDRLISELTARRSFGLRALIFTLLFGSVTLIVLGLTRLF